MINGDDGDDHDEDEGGDYERVGSKLVTVKQRDT